MKKLIAILTAAVMLFAMAACQKQPTWQEQYDLGIHYLSQGNYEEAIIALQLAIDIDPKNIEAYEKLAEIYVEIEEFDKAEEILNTAIEVMEEEEQDTAPLQEQLQQVERLKEEKAEKEKPSRPDPDEDEEEEDDEEEEPEDLSRTERVDNEDGTYRMEEYDANGRLIRVTIYAADGTVLQIVEPEYGEDGKIIRSVERNPDGTITIIREFDANGKEIAFDQYDADGNVIGSVEYEYDENGNLIREIRYDASGKIDDIIEYDADGNVIVYEEPVSSESTSSEPAVSEPTPSEPAVSEPVSSTKPVEEVSSGNRTQRVEERDGGYSIIEYNAAGDVLRRTWYTAGNVVESWLESEYDAAGNEQTCTWYSADGSLFQIAEYEYDANGNYLGCVIYDANGIIRQSIKDDPDGMRYDTWYTNGVKNSTYIHSLDANRRSTRQIATISYDNGVKEYMLEFDEEMNIIRETTYNPDGSLKEIVEY